MTAMPIPVHWTSPDGLYGVVECCHLPVGIMRTPNRGTVSLAAGQIRGMPHGLTVQHRAPGSGLTGVGCYSLIHLADLGATVQTGYDAVADPYQQREALRGASTPAKKVVEDWPIRCPKCGRDKAAVLLFSDYDCRFGCYARKAGVQ